MLRSDADSGRSSCSTGSAAVPQPLGVQRRLTREASTNTELRVQETPRNPTAHRLLSPAHIFPVNRHHFTSSHHDLHQHFAASQLTIAPRRGGLTNAFSTIDLISSTQIDQSLPHQIFQPHLDGAHRRDPNVRRTGVSRLKVRRQPVQRAASRLYRSNSVQGRGEECIGPEFIVRATHPSKQLDIMTMHSGEKRTVVVILLNGQKIDVACDPNTATAGEVFQAIIQLEKFEDNFMLGISALVGGDFVFLPDDYKIRKVAPEMWCGGSSTLKKKNARKASIVDTTTFTMFLRIKFFMPPNLSKVIRGGAWRNWVYLQLRRSIVEGQITLQLPQLIELTGYALQAEFGNYSQREHASGDYYVLEHYLPEGSICDNEVLIRSRVKQAHENSRNVTTLSAKEKFISTVQMFKDYGSHFYTAIWATRDGFARDVWVSISPRGMILYSRNTCITALPRDTHIGNTSSRILLQSLAWQHIHTLYYNKRTLYVIPNDKAGSGTIIKSGFKFKLKMDLNKSYFTFYLASLHHRFYMRLHADINSLLNISDEFSIPIECGVNRNNEEDVHKASTAWLDECSNFQDSYNIAVRGNLKAQNQHNHFLSEEHIEEYQNKENEKPAKTDDAPKNEKDVWTVEPKLLEYTNASSSELVSSPESCSLPRRLGVKMGTRAFNGSNNTSIQHKQFHSLDATHIDKMQNVTFPSQRLIQSDIDLTSTHSDSDEHLDRTIEKCTIDRMRILPPRNYNSKVDKSANPSRSAYVIESPKENNTTFAYRPHQDDTMVNCSIQDRLNSMGCVQSERYFKTVTLIRDANGALGMQVAEGSDGNVYVKSITPGGPAARLKQIYPGDQIISVNGKTLLNLNYNIALNLLQSASNNVEIIILQSVPINENTNSRNIHQDNVPPKNQMQSSSIVANLLSGGSISKLSLYNNRNDSTFDSEPSSSKQRDGISQLDDDMLNVEALKTINVLLALTKRNIERKSSLRRLDENISGPSRMSAIETPDHLLDHMDTYHYSSSTESTPSKRHVKNKNNSFSLVHENKAIRRRPLSVHIPSNVDLFESLDASKSSFDNNLSFRTRSCDNITVLKANQSVLGNANSMTQLKLNPVKNQMENEITDNLQSGLPKNSAYSRKWVGHVKYPVTPSKIVSVNLSRKVNLSTNDINRGSTLSDEEQIFI